MGFFRIFYIGITGKMHYASLAWGMFSIIFYIILCPYLYVFTYFLFRSVSLFSLYIFRCVSVSFCLYVCLSPSMSLFLSLEYKNTTLTRIQLSDI